MNWLFLLSVLICSSAFAQVNQTNVINFNPPIPHQPVKRGACWSTSLAVPRFGAWACGSGKESYDPCFSQQGVSNAVVCGANPALKKPGFRLELEQPLPFSMGLPGLPNEAWMMRLANGVICSAALGPQMIIQDVGTIGFQCNESGLPASVKSGLLNHFEQGAIWYAHLVHYTVQNGQYFLQGEIQQIPLETVWR